MPRAARPSCERLLLRVDEAAEALGMSRGKVYQLIAKGELETVHFDRSTRISVEAVKAFIQRHTREPQAA